MEQTFEKFHQVTWEFLVERLKSLLFSYLHGKLNSELTFEKYRQVTWEVLRYISFSLIAGNNSQTSQNSASFSCHMLHILLADC